MPPVGRPAGLAPVPSDALDQERAVFKHLGSPTTVRSDMINVLEKNYVPRGQTGIGVIANQYGPRRSVHTGISKEF
jgi:hypothetical protein